MHKQGKASPECPVSETFSGGLDWVAMEFEHHADSVAIVEEDEEEVKEGKGKKAEWQKQMKHKACLCQRLMQFNY